MNAEGQVKELNTQLETIKTHQSMNAEQQVRDLNAQVQDLTDQLEALKTDQWQEIELISGEMRRIQQESEELRAQNKLLMEQIPESEELREQNTQLREQVECLKKEVQAQVDLLSLAQEQLQQQRDDEAKGMQIEITNLKLQLDQLRGEKLALEHQLQQQASEELTVTQELHHAQSKHNQVVQDLHRQLHHLQTENDKLSEDI